ncbi:phosphatidylglycerol lysyltransferase domain-containing protein [Noviherbaspirillum galbum]|uniref:DUF2156 domain-containing protein n=1 Tax=Noviherbaspirillum galbum TaxID=2709383 RepID=A0A6B3SSS0_9BURK|nr:phosphatidylglycerol lysyltransferase domain-containing protein [Noviherbaspirillum galbum]NEX63701.1 DUF2156 domain-containing protein [Noviherbaspirillum galbum]
MRKSADDAIPMAPGSALELSHRQEIDARLAPLRESLGKDCLSEFAFPNLYLFRQAHDYRFLPGRWPCVAGLTYDGARHLMPLFDLAEAPLQVLRDLLQGYDCFYPVPAATARRLDPALFQVTQFDADADYLYAAENFRSYRGEVLRKKRQLMQQLLRQHQVTHAPLDASRIDDARMLLSGWMRDKDKGAGEADESSCHEALQLAGHFGFDASIYYADGAPAGFIIAEHLNAGTAAMRFAKGSDRYKGIYQHMFHDFAMRAKELAWINFEQDLGLPNFRQTKRSYQPAELLQKCRVALRYPSAT